VKNETDQKTVELMNEIKRRKTELTKLSKSNWRTNCTFTYGPYGTKADVYNLQVLSDVKDLIMIAAFLREKERTYKETASALKVESVPEFAWNGFYVSEWLEDITARINKIQIVDKRKKLELLEQRAQSVISPELKREMEIQAIMADLEQN